MSSFILALIVADVISGKPTEEQKSRLAWLRRIGMPKDLRVSSLPYRGPPIF